VVQKIAKRTAILFGLGLVLAAFPFFGKDWEHLRIMGVLQRLALGYGLAAFLVLALPGRWLIAAAVVILFGYWVLLVSMAPPLEDPFSLVHNGVRQLDAAILGFNHMWRGKGIPFDPEGILSTLPAIVTVLLGWWSGQIMQKRREQKMLAVRDLLAWGVVLATAGLVWDLAFPINKSLWTSTFVLYTGGLSMIFLSFSIWALDIVDGKRFTGFFLAFGANPLFAYVLAGLFTKTMLNIKWLENEEEISAYRWIYTHVFVPIDDGQFGSFLFALTFLLGIWVICRVLYRRGIYIKI
jgi:predicted acyltransferase